MLEKNVAAMVRDIRESGCREPESISRNLGEIKTELNSPNPRIKTNAILKLGYLSMLGYDLSIAHMQIIEMMANVKFVLKRPAMFVASLAFKESENREGNSLVLMTTNLFRKELVSPRFLEVGMALSCLSCVVTEGMADGLVGSVIGQATSSRPYIRKKVALALFRLIEKSPQVFITAFPKLKELLVDEDQSVQSATVCTFLEISKRNPKLTIPLIPIFFHLLKETKNNWTLIKILKLMELLSRVESRLFTKLVDAKILLNLLETNKARSVEIEILRLVVRLIPLDDLPSSQSDNMEELFEKIVTNLKTLIESGDFNIKCLAINLLVDLLERNKKSVETDFFFPVVLGCLGSTDSTVRKCASKAIKFLINSPTTYREVIQHLLTLFVDGKPGEQIDCIKGVLAIGKIENFSFLTDCEWYLRILVLLGGSTALAFSDNEEISFEIVRQYKHVALSKDAVASMKISVAALTNLKITLTPDLVAACAWTIAENCFHHWQAEHFTNDNCKILMGIFLDNSRKISNSSQVRITCLWSALRLAAAFSVHTQSQNLLSLFQSIIRDPKLSQTAPISVEKIMTIAANLVDDLARKSVDQEEVEKLFFDRKNRMNKQIVRPDDLDKPMIELPPHLKPSNCGPLIALGTISTLLGENVYNHLDEEYGHKTFSLIDVSEVSPTAVVEEPPNPLEQLFTIKSVLATR